MFPIELRRQCVLHELQIPSITDLIAIARERYRELAPDTIERLAESIFHELERSGSTRVLDVREFLDVLRAVHELQITPGGTTWRTLLYSLGLYDIQ